MIALEQAAYQKGRKYLLSPLSLELKPGRFHVILGPNGAGKTTLMHLLAGVGMPSEGQAYFNGRLFNTWASQKLAQQRAYLSQKVEVQLPFTVQEVVEMGRFPHNQGIMRQVDHKLVSESMKALKVEEFAQRKLYSLSGGEQQRVHLARVRVQLGKQLEGKWLFMDEPTNNLDIQYQYLCLTLAEQLVEQGATVVAVLHDLNLACQFADELILLDGGHLLAQDKPEKVMQEDVLRTVYGVPFQITRSEEGLEVKPCKTRKKKPTFQTI